MALDNWFLPETWVRIIHYMQKNSSSCLTYFMFWMEFPLARSTPHCKHFLRKWRNACYVPTWMRLCRWVNFKCYFKQRVLWYVNILRVNRREIGQGPSRKWCKVCRSSTLLEVSSILFQRHKLKGHPKAWGNITWLLSPNRCGFEVIFILYLILWGPAILWF